MQAWIIAPPQAIPILVRWRKLLFRFPTYGLLVSAISGQGLSGDPKPLVTSQPPQKVSIQITLHQRLQKRKKEEITFEFAFKRVSFLKNTSSFFSPSSLFWSFESGKNLCQFFSTTSSSVLDHRVTSTMVPGITRKVAAFLPPAFIHVHLK